TLLPAPPCPRDVLPRRPLRRPVDRAVPAVVAPCPGAVQRQPPRAVAPGQFRQAAIELVHRLRPLSVFSIAWFAAKRKPPPAPLLPLPQKLFPNRLTNPARSATIMEHLMQG